MGLPVRRPKPKEKHIVLAFCEELDGWARNNSQAAHNQSRSEEVRRLKQLVAHMSEQTRKMHASVTVLTQRATRHEHMARPRSNSGDGNKAAPSPAREAAAVVVPGRSQKIGS